MTWVDTGDTPAADRASALQLLPYLRQHRTALVWLVLLSIAGAAAALVQPALVGAIISRATTRGPLAWLIVALIVVAIADVALGAWQQYLLQRTAHGIVFGVRRQLVGRMLRLPMIEYDRRTSGDLVSRVGTDTEAVHGAVTGGMVEVVGSVLVGIGAAVAIFVIDPLLAVLTVLTFGIGVAAR